ncbi:ABC transporter ATP-binding protein [Rhodococcus aerolatus]
MSSPAAPRGQVRLTDLTVRLGTTTALAGLTCRAEPGAVTTVLGPPGAGKTTALRALLGLLAPTAGSATVDGRAVRALAVPARTVGHVPATAGLHPGRRVRDHLRVLADALELPAARVPAVLELVGLTAEAGLRVRRTSPAARRRLTVAAALLADPRVLVVDEPARDLDPAGAAWLRDLLRAWAGAGRTVVVAERDPREAARHDDPVVVLRGGTCVHQGPASGLLTGETVRVLAGSADPARLATALVAAGTTDVRVRRDGRLDVGGATGRDVAAVARAAGVPLHHLAEQHPDVERTYLRLTTGPGTP